MTKFYRIFAPPLAIVTAILSWYEIKTDFGWVDFIIFGLCCFVIFEDNINKLPTEKIKNAKVRL